MFSPENEYDTFINCNSIEDADSVIRALKNEIEQLKNIMEHPDYNKLYSIGINYGIRLSYARKSIEKVKQYIKNKGGEYIQTEEEQRAMNFENKIPLINKVVIKFTNSANFNAIHTATLNGEYFEVKHDLSITSNSNADNNAVVLVSKKEFLEEIASIHIGEWRTNYSLSRFGYPDCENVQWDVEISFSDECLCTRIHGAGVRPYNFSNLERLFGFDSIGIPSEINDDVF